MKARWILGTLVSLGAAACVSTQDFGSEPKPVDEGGPPIENDGGPGPFDDASTQPGTFAWEWINPTPTGRTLHAVGGTSPSDVWVAGEGGNIAHWNGTKWDLRRRGVGGETRWFSIGARSANDVWLAGEVAGRVEVVKWDGKDFAPSFPFAGGDFRIFSHGEGARLFAVVGWDILELEAGMWKKTDTSENPVFGAPVDLVTLANGDAWTILAGGKLMRLPAGTKAWKLEPPLADMPANVAGLAIASAGPRVCAFYTGRQSTGVGLLAFDGATWTLSPTSTSPIPIPATPQGARALCFADGSAALVDGELVAYASPTTAPGWRKPNDYPNQITLGAWGSFTVGNYGALLRHTSGSMAGQEVGPTIRKEIFAIDVGLDGTVVAANAEQIDRSMGNVVFFEGGVLAPWSGSGFAAPRIPVGVAALDQNDAWVLANDGSRVGVAHLVNDKWSVTRTLQTSSPLEIDEPLAIFAPAKDDVWVTARKKCPDTGPKLPNDGCTKPRTPFAWHYRGGTWESVAVTSAYKSIHGSSPNDVWFAGDDLAHWDGKTLTKSSVVKGPLAGVWSSTPARIWVWGDRGALYDGKTTLTPVEQALGAGTEWTTTGIAEAKNGDVFVLTKQGTGTALLWFDKTRTKLVEQVSSDLSLGAIRGRGDQLWAIGEGGAALRFATPSLK